MNFFLTLLESNSPARFQRIRPRSKVIEARGNTNRVSGFASIEETTDGPAGSEYVSAPCGCQTYCPAPNVVPETLPSKSCAEFAVSFVNSIRNLCGFAESLFTRS